MSVTIAGIESDRVSYDREADVLYLHVGDPQTTVDFDESPEGHHMRFDPEGRLVGVTLLHPHAILEWDGRIMATIPEHVEELAPEALNSALGAA